MASDAGTGDRMTRSEWSVIGSSIAAAIVLLGSSLVVPALFGFDGDSHTWAWVESLLLNLGATVLLIVPIEWWSSRLRRRVEDVDERQKSAVEEVREAATASAADLAAQVSSLDKRVADLAELSQSVADAAARRAGDDERQLEALACDAPTSESLGVALARARERKLLSRQGIRVPVARDGSMRLRFEAGHAGGPLVVLETIAGESRQAWTWRGDESAAEFFGVVADSLDGEGERVSLDVGFVLRRLSESLLTALRVQEARPLVELCPPQWAITDDAVVAVTDGGYSVTHARSDRVGMDSHVRKKPWLDMDSYERAVEIAGYLFPVTDQQWASVARHEALRDR